MRGSHREVVGMTVVDSKLVCEIIQREKGMTGVEVSLVFSVTAFYLAVVAWSIRTNQFMADAEWADVASKGVGRWRLLLEKRFVNSKPLSV